MTDLSPIRVFNALRVFVCRGTTEGKTAPLADLTPLKGMNLAGLTQLDLSWTKVGDAGLANFKDCKALTFLDLRGTKVSDVGLDHFKDLKALKHLGLGGTKVSDIGLANFKACKNLTTLLLYGTQVDDAGLAHFKDCKNLTELNLAYTRANGTGLANFKGTRLTSLAIDNSDITDLTPLQGLPLEVIYLTPKRITQGLDMLREMKSLKTIGVAWAQAWPPAEFWARYDKRSSREFKGGSDGRWPAARALPRRKKGDLGRAWTGASGSAAT